MSGNKSFSSNSTDAGKTKSSGKKRLSEFTREFNDRFTELTDTFKDYVNRGNLFLRIKDSEDGLETATITSDKTYTHTQILPDISWVVIHDLNKYPNVTILDSNNKKIDAEVKYIDLNNLMINFEEALTGKVICN